MLDSYIEGYRRYNIDWDTYPPTLRGSFAGAWESRERIAECKKGPSIASAIIVEGNIHSRLVDIIITPDETYELTVEQGTAFRHLSEEQYHCKCGIYVARSDDELTLQGYKMPVIAKVTGYGAVEEHELGYKVSHCRIEHLWYDVEISDYWKSYPDGIKYAAFRGIQEGLQDKYGVKCDIGGAPPAPSCSCGREDREHLQNVWRTKDGRKYLICQMETSHIVNAGKVLERAYADPHRNKWLGLFREELQHRAARRDEQGKLIVHF